MYVFVRMHVVQYHTIGSVSHVHQFNTRLRESFHTFHYKTLQSLRLPSLFHEILQLVVTERI